VPPSTNLTGIGSRRKGTWWPVLRHGLIFFPDQCFCFSSLSTIYQVYSVDYAWYCLAILFVVQFNHFEWDSTQVRSGDCLPFQHVKLLRSNPFSKQISPPHFRFPPIMNIRFLVHVNEYSFFTDSHTCTHRCEAACTI
jgi:hypothetical protein